MKILHVIHRFVDTARRGSELYTYNLSRSLADKHEVAVLYTSARQAPGSLTRSHFDGLTTFVVGTDSSWEEAKLQGRSRPSERAFRRVLHTWEPDVVHFHHLLFHSLGLPTIARSAGVPTMLTLHDFWLLCPQINLLDHRQRVSWPINRSKCVTCCAANAGRAYSWRRLWGWEPTVLAQKAARALYLRRGRPRFVAKVFEDVGLFVAPSHHVRDRFVQQGAPASRVVVCGHGIGHELRPPHYRPKEDRSGPLRCGYVGTIAPHKGIDVLLEAFAGIHDASVVVYGAVPPAYAARARTGTIRFMGELRDDDKAAAFGQMDVLIVPSIWFETHSLVTQEAFLFGVPVLASAIGALPELVDDGQNGLLFRPGDSADLRSKIEHLARNRDHVRALAARVPRVKSTAEHMGEIEEFYERVLTERRGG